MSKYRREDIVKVPYPYSDDFSQSKIRPAIIVSNHVSNNLGNDYLVVPTTSLIRRTPFSFVIDNKDLTNSLPLNGEVRCNKITTMRQHLILGKTSSLKIEKQEELSENTYNSLK
jgi:mRNA-degrading endonuclease toxin of MazEF toxin-antitoxin module